MCFWGAVTLLPIWHVRPVKPAKQEQVKEGFPVMQSSMQRPPFRQGLRCGQTDADKKENICRYFKLYDVIMCSLFFCVTVYYIHQLKSFIFFLIYLFIISYLSHCSCPPPHEHHQCERPSARDTPHLWWSPPLLHQRSETPGC